MVNYAYLIPVFPLGAFVLNILFGKKLKLKSALVSIIGIFCSLVLSTLILKEVMSGIRVEQSFIWFNIANYSFKVGFLVDPLTAMMLIVVTFIGLLIQIYSIGYMHGDKGYSRFFAYMSLFTFSMLGLVLANNFIEIYIFWELVGLCSYLLIGFWFEKTSAAAAGKKAFITTRIGDAGFFIGIAILFYYLDTLNFNEIAQKIGQGGLNQNILAVSAILIFLGAVGKSAQFPLHVWLPDAMEGPTPVSAFIHAATMVAAGIYLVARTYTIFVAGNLSLQLVAYIGIITAVMAASIALVQNDIKRILAYSTISQLGFMMTALGVGGYTAGTFHLMTHAFFKALLFLCAGSVIHSTGVQDIRQMGGLFGKMKITATTCLIGCLAIAGVPPLSGFWSKDEILLAIYSRGHILIYILALIASFMTAFYIFRLLFLTFFGKPRNDKIQSHESPIVMTCPLIVLALFSALIGFVNSPLASNYFSNFIYFHSTHTQINYFVMLSSTTVILLGIFLAWVFYVLSPQLPLIVSKNFKSVYTILLNKYWIDEIYSSVIIKPFLRLTKLSFSFDFWIVDGLVNLSATLVVIISRIKGLIDQYIVDGIVNLVGAIVRGLGLGIRRLQSGFVQNYLLLIFTGIIIIILLKLI